MKIYILGVYFIETEVFKLHLAVQEYEKAQLGSGRG